MLLTIYFNVDRFYYRLNRSVASISTVARGNLPPATCLFLCSCAADALLASVYNEPRDSRGLKIFNEKTTNKVEIYIVRSKSLHGHEEFSSWHVRVGSRVYTNRDGKNDPIRCLIIYCSKLIVSFASEFGVTDELLLQ